MSIVITDTALIQKLVQASGTVEVRDVNGNFLGTFAPTVGKLPPGLRSPFTEEEIERRRGQPDGRPLAAILRDDGGRLPDGQAVAVLAPDEALGTSPVPSLRRHSILDIPTVRVGAVLRPLPSDDDLLDEMLEEKKCQAS